MIDGSLSQWQLEVNHNESDIWLEHIEQTFVREND